MPPQWPRLRRRGQPTSAARAGRSRAAGRAAARPGLRPPRLRDWVAAARGRRWRCVRLTPRDGRRGEGPGSRAGRGWLGRPPACRAFALPPPPPDLSRSVLGCGELRHTTQHHKSKNSNSQTPPSGSGRWPALGWPPLSGGSRGRSDAASGPGRWRGWRRLGDPVSHCESVPAQEEIRYKSQVPINLVKKKQQQKPKNTSQVRTVLSQMVYSFSFWNVSGAARNLVKWQRNELKLVVVKACGSGAGPRGPSPNTLPRLAAKPPPSAPLAAAFLPNSNLV